MKTLEKLTGSFQKHALFPWALRGTLLLCIALLGLEAVIYPGVLQNNLGLPGLIWALLPLLLFFVFGRSISRVIPQQIQCSLLWITTAIFAVVFFSTLADYLFHANYTFSTFHFHPLGLLPLGLFGALSTQLFSAPEIAQKQFSWRVFVLPFWLFAFIFPLRFGHPETWVSLVREDSLVEYLTMLAYLFASIIAFISAWLLKKMPDKHFSSPLVKIALLVSIVLFGLGCFLIAGDEISWGQRIVGLETPEKLAEQNTQGEFNWHNNRTVYGNIYNVYNAVSFVGMTAWIVSWLLQRFAPKHFGTQLAKILVPPWQIALFFLPSYIFTLLRTEPVQYEVILWEETSELFLGAGFMMTATWIWLRVRALAKFD